MSSYLAIKIYAATYERKLISKVRAFLCRPPDGPVHMELNREDILIISAAEVTLEVVTEGNLNKPGQKLNVVHVNGSPFITLHAKDEPFDDLGELPQYETQLPLFPASGRVLRIFD